MIITVIRIPADRRVTPDRWVSTDHREPYDRRYQVTVSPADSKDQLIVAPTDRRAPADFRDLLIVTPAYRRVQADCRDQFIVAPADRRVPAD